MRAIVMGAGAVGALIAGQLAAAGHEVCFWVRASQDCDRAQLALEPIGKLRVHRRAAAATHASVQRLSARAHPLPKSDWLFVCVRGEQLDAALQQLVQEFGPDRNVVISAVSIDNVVERARRHGLQGCVLVHHPSFGVFRDPVDPQHFLWFPFAPPSLISADGEHKSLTQARAVAALLSRSGLRTRAVRSVSGPIRYMMVLSAPFIAAWDLCDFQLERLGRDPAMRRLTARAMVEAPRSLQWRGAARLLPLLPARLWELILRLLPWVIGSSGRELWLHHGPKIREQTRYCLTLLLRAPAPMPVLRALAEQFDAERGD